MHSMDHRPNITANQFDPRAQAAVARLDDFWADANRREKTLLVDSNLYHAGPSTLRLTNNQSIWTGHHPATAEKYLQFGGLDYPRVVLTFVAHRRLRLAIMPESCLFGPDDDFHDGFTYNYCDGRHFLMSQTIAAWGATRGLDGVTYDLTDEVIIFRPADVIDIGVLCGRVWNPTLSKQREPLRDGAE